MSLRPALRRRIAALLAVTFAVAPLMAPLTVAAAPPLAARDLREVPIEEVTSGNKIALIVGCAKYAKTLPLDYTTNDATALADFLIRKWGFKTEDVHLLVDGASDSAFLPTRGNLLDQIDWLVSRANENSDVVVFFSGHGIIQDDENYLVPVDANPKRIQEDCIASTKKIVNALEIRNPRRALIFLDACRNFGKGSATAQGPNPANSRIGRMELVANLSRTPGRRIPYRRTFTCAAPLPAVTNLARFSSCRPTEKSLEDPDLQHGVFSYYLLKGLNGERKAAEENTGEITFDSLSTFVQQSVYQYVRQRGGSQTPMGNATSGSRLVLGRAFPPPPDKSEQEKEEATQQTMLSLFKGQVNTAYTLLAQGKPEAAEGVVTSLIEQDKLAPALHFVRSSPDVHFILGRCQAERTRDPDLNGALRELQTAQTLNPNLAGLSDTLSAVAKQMKQPAEDPMALAREAVTLAQAGQLADAEAKARALLAKNPPDAAQAQAHYVLGLTLRGAKTDEETLRLARTELDRALQLDPALAGAAAAKRELLDLLVKNAQSADAEKLANDAERLVDGRQFLDAESRARQALDSASPGAKTTFVARSNYVLGRVAQSRGAYDEALSRYATAVSIDPTFDASVRQWRSQAEAEKANQAATARRTRDAQALFEAAKSGPAPDLDARANTLLAAKSDDPNVNALAHFALGQGRFAAKEYDAAIREYQEANRLAPSLSEARVGVQLALKEKGVAETQTATTALVADMDRLATAGNLTEAETKARTLLATSVAEPAVNARAHVTLGRAFQTRHRADDARAEFQTALALDPANADAKPLLSAAQAALDRDAAAQIAAQAYTHLVHEEYLDAKLKADEALEKDNRNAQAHAARGLAMLALYEDPDRQRQGAQDIQDAQQTDPDASLVHVALAAPYWNAWDQDRAAFTGTQDLENANYRSLEKQFQLALKGDPKSLLALNGLGAAYSTLGVIYFRRAQPKTAKEKLDKALMAKANQLFDKAEAIFKQALAVDDQFAGPYINLGNVNFMRGQMEAAEANYRKAIPLAPKNAQVHGELAGTLYRQNRLPEATAEAQTALRMGLKDHWVYPLLKITP